MSNKVTGEIKRYCEELKEMPHNLE